MIQIGTDFQGIPVDAMTLREILLRLGFKTEGDKFSINKDDPILDAYPLTYEDDGMAYGVNPEFIVTADKDTYEKKVKEITYEVGDDKKLDITIHVKDTVVPVFNLFRDVPENKVDDDE